MSPAPAREELHPFASRPALDAAAHLGLGNDPKTLAGLVDAEFARLVAALVRTDLGEHAAEIPSEAGKR